MSKVIHIIPLYAFSFYVGHSSMLQFTAYECPQSMRDKKQYTNKHYTQSIALPLLRKQTQVPDR